MKSHYLVVMVAVIALSSAPAVSIRSAEAQTKVSAPHGRDITITVPIDAAGADNATAKFWKVSAQIYWNSAFNDPAVNLYKGCFTLMVNVDVQPVPLNAKERPDRHMIFATGKAPTDVAHGGFPDTVDPYKIAKNGYFDPVFNDPYKAIHVAHEVGHLMGLPDEYKTVSEHPRKTEPLPGRQHTLMADGGRIDPQLITELVDRIRKATHNVPD